jgi:hypothetical protein
MSDASGGDILRQDEIAIRNITNGLPVLDRAQSDSV